MTKTHSGDRRAGSCAISSGLIGLVSFACLIIYLATQASQFIATGVMPPLGRLLINANYVGTLLQALLMVPVARELPAWLGEPASGPDNMIMRVGVAALLGVVIVRLLQFASPAVSDVLFMAPLGFVGLWLIAVNLRAGKELHAAMRLLGVIAGLGMAILGGSFFFLGGLAVLTDGPFAYTNNVPFHQGIAIGSPAAYVLYPIWCGLIGRKLLLGVTPQRL